jgi:electron transfer flavoprotein beta subunit
MFHALVSIKQVPDTTNIRIDPETNNLIRQGVPAILNPYDAHAVGAAVEWKRKLHGKVTVITMGPPAAAIALRECIELGADRAILISARQFAGADTLATSYVLAEVTKAIHEQDPIDLLFFGKQAIDGDTAQVGPGVAVRLGLPVVIERKTENRNEVIKASLPAAMTCEKDIAEIPFASLPDLVYSLRYEPEVWSAESPIKFDLAQLGLKGSPTTVFKTSTPERHVAGEVFKVADLGVEWVVKAALDKIKASVDVDSISGVKK